MRFRKQLMERLIELRRSQFRVEFGVVALRIRCVRRGAVVGLLFRLGEVGVSTAFEKLSIPAFEKLTTPRSAVTQAVPVGFPAAG